MTDTRKVDCEQFQCSHHPENDTIPAGFKKDLLISLCPICDECKAEPHLVTPSCKNCLLCENQEGYIRRGLPKNMIAIEILQKEQEENVIKTDNKLQEEQLLPKQPNVANMKK